MLMQYQILLPDIHIDKSQLEHIQYSAIVNHDVKIQDVYDFL